MDELVADEMDGTSGPDEPRDSGDTDEVVDALRRDLQDGEDLALAMQLVADALDRRLARVRRSLVLAGSAGSSEVGGLVDRLRRQVDEHRTTLDQHRARLQSAVDDVQRLMETAADELELDDA